jgi:hypothetical protein
MYDPDNGFYPLNIDDFLPHFAVLHRMVRKTLAPRIGDGNACLTYERNLLDTIMKNENFDTFDYIMDKIWNISINPLRSCVFPPYIMCMIEMVAHKHFVKNVAHEPLHPALAKVPIW